MAVKLKQGVTLQGVQPEILVALQVADGVFAKYRQDAVGVLGGAPADCIITSCRDGNHKRGSKHNTGHAIDLRTRHLRGNGTDAIIVTDLATALGAEFDVVLESNHIHVEYDPK